MKLVLTLLALLALAGCGGKAALNPDPPISTFVAPSANSEAATPEAIAVASQEVKGKTEMNNSLFVSPSGDDKNDGSSKDSAFKTLERARDAARDLKSAFKGDITVYLSGGEYQLSNMLTFTPKDSGARDARITYKAVSGETPVISGGFKVSGWEKAELDGNEVYVARIPEGSGIKHIRQFYANGIAQPRSSTAELAWTWKGVNDKSGIKTPLRDLSSIKDISSVEVFWPVEWKVFFLKAASSNRREIAFQEPYYQDFLDMMEDRFSVGEVPMFYPNTKFGLYLQNDLSFVNEKGEWFYDEKSRELHYYPADGVDMKSSEFYVPVLEQLMSVEGGTKYNTVGFLTFEGIEFRHGAWNEPSESGLIINQAQNQMVMTRDSGKIVVNYENIPSNITVKNAESLVFKDCVFSGMGATALSFESNVKYSTVQGCVFKELSEGGVSVSNSGADKDSFEQKCIGNKIDNNVFRRIGLDYWSAIPITVYYASETQITHNDIYGVPYSGISLGWGWYFAKDSTVASKNLIADNKIGGYLQKLRDGGGIYTLGQQPDSEIRGNYIFEEHAAYGGIYLDEGSAYFKVSGNVIDIDPSLSKDSLNWLNIHGLKGGPNGGMTTYDLEVFGNYHNIKNELNSGEPATVSVHDNFFVESGKFPAEAEKIIGNAGLQEEYKHLLSNVK
ncbi:MAG: right-handed parallel beta-helix repeat-containing protein [Clostridiales bacterium]|jgi:hypothetical protein|nr:right-handed parallel beta-helix repeat-containing protein [Clostridiales bacterium]